VGAIYSTQSTLEERIKLGRLLDFGRSGRIGLREQHTRGVEGGVASACRIRLKYLNLLETIKDVIDTHLVIVLGDR
jgi:hypothetical protein